MPKTPKQKTGMEGEEHALRYFAERNFRILKKNYRKGRAEVDLVLQQGSFLIFVEVKTRSDSDYGYPESFVTRNQKRNIRLASEFLVEKYQWSGPIRFDILAILLEGNTVSEVVHFEDAF